MVKVPDAARHRLHPHIPATMAIARSKSGRILAAIILLILGGLPIYFCVYQPLKFDYLTHRISSAHTAEEERSALELAKQWGDIWEVMAVDSDSGKTIKSPGAASPFLEDPAISHVTLELTWMQTKYPSGIPYRAKRSLIDKENLHLFF